MDARNLCAAAGVCASFNRNARAEFSLRYKFLNVKNNEESALPLNRLAGVLRTFGSSIVTIDVSLDHRNQSPRIMNLITRHCSESLSELALKNVEFTPAIIKKMQPLLLRLQVLRICHCTWKPQSLVTEMFSSKSLQDSVTSNIRAESPKLKSRAGSPKLKKFTIDCTKYISNESIDRFLSVNPQLKEITIFDCDSVTSGIIPSIAKYTPHIEKISLTECRDSEGDFFEHARHLKQLTALKVLRMECCGQPFSPVLKELSAAQFPLEHLHLSCLGFDAEIANEIIKWKNLKTLRLQPSEDNKLSDVLMMVRNLSELIELSVSSDSIFITDFVEIVRNAPKLERFEYDFTTKSIFDADLFMKIRNVVANRKTIRPLNLLAFRERQIIDVPAKLRQANENVLKIDFVDF